MTHNAKNTFPRIHSTIIKFNFLAFCGKNAAMSPIRGSFDVLHCCSGTGPQWGEEKKKRRHCNAVITASIEML
ncbi:hypothetical protein EXN66_Car004143 [Channa argus]|uniref:Uncharacterized protein n=1 Tax=Channa argus TaxID=215402 RepID=A0A6G1PDT3_CHAAH|nr:hypothetical protein EXN66_Car004143 [Channa argus]